MENSGTVRPSAKRYLCTFLLQQRIYLVLFLTARLSAALPTIQIPRIDTPPSLSDFAEMQPSARVAGKMAKITGFIAREPADGAEPTQNTDVYLAYDQHNLYAVFVCWDKEPEKIRARMNEVQTHRETAQPIREKTGGSTFKNPPGHSAWKLIDAAGCRGLRLGGAQVSEMHCNFLINTGSATGHDIETLGETVRVRVKQNCGIELQWEIKRIGIAP